MHGDKITSQSCSRCSHEQEINRFSEETKITRRPEPHRDPRTLREFCKTSMLRLQFLYGNRDYVLQLRRNLKYKRSPTTLQKTNCDFTSIPWLCHQEEFQSRTKHGESERQIMFFKAKDMLRDSKEEESFRQFSQDGKQPKNTGNR